MPFRLGRRDQRGEHAPASTGTGQATVPFNAFGLDCRIAGRIVLRAERLTDQVNGDEPLALEDVIVTVLADGRQLQVGDLVVERDELYAVEAVGPRGNPARRLRTRTRAVDVKVGPYDIHADVHGTPASDPLARATRGPAFVPLTDATISYWERDAASTESRPVLLVNRLLAEAFRATDAAQAPVAHEAALG